MDEVVRRYLAGEERDRWEPVLDRCVMTYVELLDADGRVDFKSKAKAFIRTYNFLSAVLPYANPSWEKLAIFLEFLVRKLPQPVDPDDPIGLLRAVDMDSYRAEKQATLRIELADADAEILPIPVEGRGHIVEPELDFLSNILREFNERFGNIAWTDADRVRKLITQEIPARVAADPQYQNARRNSDAQNARVEHDKALGG